MDYQKIYNNIIIKAKNENRTKGSIYYENHHIIPKCLGGTNLKENLVLLTGKEHFICHLILWKISEGENKNKMGHALFSMVRNSRNQNRKFTSRSYEKAKKIHSDILKNTFKGIFLTEEKEIQRIENLKKGLKKYYQIRGKKTYEEIYGLEKSKELKENRKISATKPMSINQKNNISRSKIGKKSPLIGRKISENHKQKISIFRKSMHVSSKNWLLIDPMGNEFFIEKIGITQWLKINYGCNYSQALKTSNKTGNPVIQGKWKGWICKCLIPLK